MGGISTRARAAPLLIVALLLAAVGHLAHGQVEGEYYHEILPDGTPFFTQVLRWEADPHVRYYQIVVQTLDGREVVVCRVKEAVAFLHLSPGQYRYRIVLHNLLGDPEVELPWMGLTVLKAELPRITGIAPRRWYLDELEPAIVIKGSDLSPGATVVLNSTEPGRESLTGTVRERDASGTVRVEFPAHSVATGDYHLKLINPGGLTCVVSRTFPVRHDRPVDMVTTVGFAPWIALYDGWYTATWPGTFFPISFAGRLCAFFVKSDRGSFGTEISSVGRSMTGGGGGAQIGTTVSLTGFSAVYRLSLSELFSATGRIGGGLAFGRHSVSFEGQQGAEIAGIDPYVAVGLTTQYWLTRRVFLEAGVDWMHASATGYTAGGFLPSLSVGMQR